MDAQALRSCGNAFMVFAFATPLLCYGLLLVTGASTGWIATIPPILCGIGGVVFLVAGLINKSRRLLLQGFFGLDICLVIVGIWLALVAFLHSLYAGEYF